MAETGALTLALPPASLPEAALLGPASLPSSPSFSSASSDRRPPREEHDAAQEAFLADLWHRLDRDHSGSITRSELDCEAFHEVIRAAISPDRATTGGASHARAELNMRDAIQFCLRKADQNGDACLSWEEFRSMVMCLQNSDSTSADLAFSLFDLDCSRRIDQREFKELCRFFLGRNATTQEFRDEWLRLIHGGNSEVEATKRQYLRWLRTTPNPAFARHAPRQHGEEGDGGGSGGGSQRRRGGGGALDRPKWNKRINTGPNPGHINDSLTQDHRQYFQKAQSLPELKRFYDSFGHTDGFRRQRRSMDLPPVPAAKAALLPKCLSSEGGTPLTLPGRHQPDGTMADHKTGRPAIWEDNFILPLRFRARDRHSDRPLAPRALFGGLTDSMASRSSQSHGKSTSSFGSGGSRQSPAGSESSSRGRGARRSAQQPRDPDNTLDIRPARATTLEPIPW